MNYTLAEEKPCKRVFRVELTAEEYERIRATATARMSARMSVPGFRKGKVPAQVLAQRLGSRLDEEVVEEGINGSARRILEETRLVPVTNPTVSGVQRSAEGMTFSLTVELASEVVLGDYQGLELEREAVIVRPEEIDGVIDGFRRRHAAYVCAERPARWGDLAAIDYAGTVDGQPFEGSSSQNVMVFIGSGEAMRELEESLVGHRAGDVFETLVAYPSDHSSRELAGKTAVLSVTLKELKAAKLPDLTDDFVSGLGGEYKTVEQLRAAVRSRLRAERDEAARGRLRAAVVDRLTKFVPGEVAPTLVEEEMQFMAMRGAEELGRQGMRDVRQLRLDSRGFREMFRPAATRAVREAFVLEAIARQEGIAVSDEELEREIRGSKVEDASTPDKVISSLRSGGRWDRLRHRLQQDRTLDWIIGKARVTEKVLAL